MVKIGKCPRPAGEPWAGVCVEHIAGRDVRAYVSDEPRAEQSARHRDSDRAGVPFHHGLPRLAAVRAAQARRAALRLAGVPDHRQPALARLRPVLRMERCLPDVTDVLSVRPVRVAEPPAQKKLHIPDRPPAAARPADDPGDPRADADRALSGLSRHHARSERRRLLAPVPGAAVLAVRTAMVPVAAADPQHRRGGAAQGLPDLGRPSRQARGRNADRSAPLHLDPHRRVGARLRADGADLFAVGLVPIQRVRVPMVPAAALHGLFLRRRRRRRLWARARTAGDRQRAGAALAARRRRGGRRASRSG